MTNQPVLDVQEGIWIDKRSFESVDDIWTEEAIDVFRSLGQDTEVGQLKDTSINHDLYLYGKTE